MATTRSVTLYLDYTSIDILDYTECPAKNSLYKASFGIGAAFAAFIQW